MSESSETTTNGDNKNEWVPDLAVRFFIAGLRSGAASKFVYHRKPKCLAEAVSAAEEFEAVVGWRSPEEEERLKNALVDEGVCDSDVAQEFADVIADLRLYSAPTSAALLKKERQRLVGSDPNRRLLNRDFMSLSFDFNECTYCDLLNLTYEHSLLRIDVPLPKWLKKLEARLPENIELPGIWQ